MNVWADPYRRRWLLWGILAISFLLVSLYRLSTAVIAHELMSAFGTTGAQLGTLHATFFFIYALMQIPTGILVDRVGSRRTAALGAMTMNGGAIWFSIATEFHSALGARLLIGLGGSVIFVSMLRYCANWYRADEFATMNGMCFAVGGIGGIAATTPFALVINITGWRMAILSLGVIGITFAILTFVFVRDSAERAGFSPIEGTTEHPYLTLPEIQKYLSIALRDPWTWVVTLLLFCTGGMNFTIFGLWGIPFVVQLYGTTVTFASLFTLIGGIGAVIGPPVFGWFADRTNRRGSLIVVGSAVYSLSFAVIAITGRPPLVVVGVVFFLAGMLLGSFVLTFPMIKDRHPSRASGIALGSINGASFIGASVIPPLMGIILDVFWTGEIVSGVRVYTQSGYQIAFGFAAGIGAIAFVCALWIYYYEHP